MSFRVTVLRRAKRDLLQISDWIAERSPQGASRWIDAYERAVALLAESADGYGLAPEDEFVEFDLRQFFFRTRRGRTYRGVFTIVEDEVRVLRIRGPGQSLLEPDELE